jgi:hypothetical protein
MRRFWFPIRWRKNQTSTGSQWRIVWWLSLCLTKHHAMKTYWGSGYIAPRSLDLGTRWRWVVSFTPRPLYPQGKSPWHTLDRKLGGPQSRSGRGGEEKNSQPTPGIKPLNPDHPARSPVLYRYERGLLLRRENTDVYGKSWPELN